ncbi:hypothetical protein N7475_010067 [Penicillium sp. IBT 31633x]|nr:hypothetical protein N7475_010067 [Penicillium sp. IBT 31633x]
MPGRTSLPLGQKTIVRALTLTCLGVKLLLANKADHNMKDNSDGMTSLHCAAKEGHQEVVKLLLRQGANPNILSSRGITPLDYAMQNGHKEVAILLLKKDTGPKFQTATTAAIARRRYAMLRRMDVRK